MDEWCTTPVALACSSRFRTKVLKGGSAAVCAAERTTTSSSTPFLSGGKRS